VWTADSRQNGELKAVKKRNMDELNEKSQLHIHVPDCCSDNRPQVFKLLGHMSVPFSVEKAFQK